MSSFEPVISVQELDNYTALVNAALGAAHAKSMRYRHGGGALPTHVNVTLVYAPAVSKGESQRSTAPTQVTWQSSCDVIVGATAPTTYARGQVWLRTGATSADENTFFVASTTSPTAAYWHPISDPSLLFSTDRALALADTSVLKHLDSLVKMDANGDITDAAAVAALQAVPGLGGSGGGVVLALGITDSGATGRDLLRAATPAVAKTALAIAASDVSGLSAAATSTLKTINGTSILGSGDIVISGGGGGSVTINTTLTSTSTTEAASASTVKTLQDTKQANLVSGTNIKTVNGTSILGSGNIVISGGGGASVPVLRTIDTAGRTLAAADLGNLVRYNSASNANFTIPTDVTLGITDANANVSIELYQIGTGRLDIVADTANGVTLNKWVGYPTSTQFVSQTIHRVAPNTWAVK